jgi:hypothetical protein
MATAFPCLLDNGGRSRYQHAAQHLVSGAGNLADPGLARGRIVLRGQPHPGRKVAAGRERAWIGRLQYQRDSANQPDPRNLRQAPAVDPSRGARVQSRSPTGAGSITVFSPDLATMSAGCVSSPRYKKAVADFSDRWRLSLLGTDSCQKLLSRVKTAVLGEWATGTIRHDTRGRRRLSAVARLDKHPYRNADYDV